MNKRLPLTAGRLLALFIGAPLALFAIGWIALTEVAYAGQGSYRVHLLLPAGGGPVDISVDSGELHVSSAADANVLLTGTARYGPAKSSVIRHVSGRGVTVASRCHLVSWECSFRLDVAVPAGNRVTLSVGKGTIVATGITNADVTAADGSGDITLTFTKVPDRVDVKDAFGDVRIVLPAGATAYKVSTQALLGTSTISVPTSSRSPHIITALDSSGSITITN